MRTSTPPVRQQTRAFGRVFHFYIPKNIPKNFGFMCSRLPSVGLVGRP